MAETQKDFRAILIEADVPRRLDELAARLRTILPSNLSVSDHDLWSRNDATIWIEGFSSWCRLQLKMNDILGSSLIKINIRCWDNKYEFIHNVSRIGFAPKAISSRPYVGFNDRSEIPIDDVCAVAREVMWHIANLLKLTEFHV
ncbi:hypothetical protein [Prosthecodimorpha staleyi]|uniref:Uncharacterized protein n=1 Tax=Prosthecodimorpha staleyi TaxID=2840188 RepID=A0A947D4X7_9HYPH|nr:hypothetical protein [Prosthecodimorpha staleyi]MBT9291103.1 hypothetical protein [Prosthecodimorpha staleyi]